MLPVDSKIGAPDLYYSRCEELKSKKSNGVQGTKSAFIQRRYRNRLTFSFGFSLMAGRIGCHPRGEVRVRIVVHKPPFHAPELKRSGDRVNGEKDVPLGGSIAEMHYSEAFLCSRLSHGAQEHPTHREIHRARVNAIQELLGRLRPSPLAGYSQM